MGTTHLLWLSGRPYWPRYSLIPSVPGWRSILDSGVFIKIEVRPPLLISAPNYRRCCCSAEGSSLRLALRPQTSLFQPNHTHLLVHSVPRSPPYEDGAIELCARQHRLAATAGLRRSNLLRGTSLGTTRQRFRGMCGSTAAAVVIIGHTHSLTGSAVHSSSCKTQ